ncbi:MAG: N-acetyltransferase [Planctomycetota bacterium]
MPVTLRAATVRDVPAMGRIINDAAEFGLMLPKSLAALYENVREFQVAVDDDDAVVGCSGLSIVWANLAELASLAVDPDYRGQGLGKRLVQACLEEAAALGIRRVMTLTYEQAFFEKLGFAVVDRLNLPHKVWAECVRCPKHDACDEIAMMRTLEHVPEPTVVPEPPGAAAASYAVPVTLSATRKPPAG